MNKVISSFIISVIVSYLFNSYCYNSFNPQNFPLEAKILLCLGVLIILGISSIVKSELINDLKNEVEKLKNK